MKQKDVLWVRRGSVTKCDRDDGDDGDERTTRQIRTRFPNAVRYLVYLSACPLVCLSACPVSSVPLLSLREFREFREFKVTFPNLPNLPNIPNIPNLTPFVSSVSFVSFEKECATHPIQFAHFTFFPTFANWRIINLIIL